MKALAEDRIVLTLDLDFGDLALLTREPAARVILFRLENTRTIHVIERLETVPAGSSDALARGAVVIVEEGRQRIPYLPIGETGT
jgi:predicted nuclease of predicted toxin-antitoxin system